MQTSVMATAIIILLVFITFVLSFDVAKLRRVAVIAKFMGYSPSILDIYTTYEIVGNDVEAVGILFCCS